MIDTAASVVAGVAATAAKRKTSISPAGPEIGLKFTVRHTTPDAGRVDADWGWLRNSLIVSPGSPIITN